jgi:hypothetical protein
LETSLKRRLVNAVPGLVPVVIGDVGQ